MARVLIAGCGDLGTRVGLRLAARGDQVLGLRRNADRLPPEIRGRSVDLADPASLQAITELPDAVVYAAAADEPTDEAYRLAYSDGPGNLLGRLADFGARPRRFLFVSSTRVFSQNDGSWVDEGSPTHAWHFTAARLLEGEAAVISHGGVCLRLGGIYGPERRSLIDRSIQSPPADPEDGAFTNRIHINDAVRSIVHLLDLESADPLYIGVDHLPARQGEVVAWLQAQTGRSGTTQPPPSRPKTNKRCSSRLLRSTGFEFHYPTYREGYLELLSKAG